MPLALITDLFKIYFHEMEKLLPIEGVFEQLEQNDGFHQPENQFSLARMKEFLENKFTVDGKKALTTRCIGKMGKKCFLLARKSVSTSRNKVIFQKSDFPVSTSRKKYLNKKKMFQLDKKCFHQREWSNMSNNKSFKQTFL